jgi:hypothetical protein
MFKHVYCGLTAVALSIGAQSADAGAPPPTVVTVVCPLTGPAIAGCVFAGTVLHETIQGANGKDGFGPNGEVRKLADDVSKGIGGIQNGPGLLGGSDSVFRKIGIPW